MTKEISINKVRSDAEELYRDGKFFCSEAIVASVKKNIAPDMPAELISASSGFPVGVGRSKCMCGAISGAVICLGYFFGRTEPSDSKSKHCLNLANELQESFRKNHDGVLCCHVHTKAWIWQKGNIRNKCISFTGEMAAKTAEIIARELNIAIVEPDDSDTGL